MQQSGRKILLVGHDARPGGAQLLALGLVRAWTAETGCAVHTMLLGGGRLLDEFKRHSHALHVAPAGDPRTAASAGRLLRRLRAEGVEAAVCNTIVAAQALPWLRDAGIATLCLIHELPATIRALGLATAPALVAEMADGIVFPAEMVRTAFAPPAALESRKIAIAPQGLYHAPPPAFDRAEARRLVRERLQLPPDARLILSVAMPETRKGFDLLPRLARELGTDSAAVCVWIGADGTPPDPWVEHDIAALGVGGRIRLLPAIDDWDVLAQHYAAADAYFLPSREDPFPTVVLEAMSFGIPVVCFDSASGVQQLVVEGGGAAVPYLDVAAAARAIRALVDDHAAWRIASAAATRRMALHTSFSAYALNVLDLAAQAAQRARERASSPAAIEQPAGPTWKSATIRLR